MGGQLGSSSSSSTLADCIAAPQKYCSRKLAVSGRSTLVRRIGRRPNSGVRPNPSLGRGRYVPFSGIKKSSSAKTSKQKSCRFTSGKLQKPKRKNRLWLWVTRNSNLSHKSAKTQKRLRLWVTQLESAAKQRATLNHKDTRDVTPNEHSRVD